MRPYLLFFLLNAAAAAGQPLLRSELIFPLETWHNHASSVVELPGGELFVCWYHGSGERTADDVVVRGARERNGKWSAPFLLADVPGFPDTNPALLLDSKQRLWLFWQTIIANEWHTALTHYRISGDYRKPGPPNWRVSEPLLVVPPDFAAKARAALEKMPPSEWRDRMMARAGDKYFSRMGWMTRAHPLELPSGRILVPLYSDGYDFSLIAITDDGGATWTASEPLVGHGSIQPSLVRRRDGSIVAYMRDNGPPPKRVHVSESRDNGVTWAPVRDTEIPNPGSGLEVIALRDGSWVMIFNDTERGRYSLAVALSDDEGSTWKWKRRLELDTREKNPASFHYPSILQARDGTLHATYSYFLNHLPADQPRKSIKHARFNVDWIKERSE